MHFITRPPTIYVKQIGRKLSVRMESPTPSLNSQFSNLRMTMIKKSLGVPRLQLPAARAPINARGVGGSSRCLASEQPRRTKPCTFQWARRGSFLARPEEEMKSDAPSGPLAPALPPERAFNRRSIRPRKKRPARAEMKREGWLYTAGLALWRGLADKNRIGRVARRIRRLTQGGFSPAIIR